MQPFSMRSERLLLNELQPGDAPAMYNYCQDPEFEKFLTIPWPYTREDATFFIEKYVPEAWASAAELTWALRQPDGTLLGVLSLRDKFGRYDIGYWLGNEHRGQGYIPEAVRVVLDWAFSSGLAEEVAWECVVGNNASVAVARKLGFTFTGTSPATVPSRNNTRPLSWHGRLRASDDRGITEGWPSPTEQDATS